MIRSGTRTWLVAAATAGSVVLTVPSSGTAGAATATATMTSSTGAADAERIVVLGEEDVLGDLLALGIVPIAATASVPDAGFHALDGYDTSTIEPLPVDLSFERLAGLDPDLIVTLQFWLDQVPDGTLESVAPVVVVPDGLDSASQVTFLGEQFRARREAAALTTELKHAQAEAAATLEGVEVTVAAIYPGPTPAVFVDGPWVVPQVLIDAGGSSDLGEATR
ncbi:ABC transporter substrate-binding protein [Desertimonas flava]|uniref:ABC transporter substrate-binding protein n=1 Tax=Desertimonas flava TaxID=2064846 RepID=UPI0013C42234|nr:ABC transporter substrate-binding protein [Desertimonas flava]